MDQNEIKYFIEAAMLAAGRPLSVDQLKALFDGRSAPDNKEIRAAIKLLDEDYEPRGIEVAEVASGFRIQVRPAMTERLQKLWEERPPRYSRALFETLALIAYRQPITRGEIEEVRGVAVSSNIVRSLMERDWIRVVGHRDVPGRPAMFGTTKAFLDYFGLKKLDDLPELSDLADWESLRVQLDLPDVEGTDGTPADVPVLHAEIDAAREEAADAEPTAPDAATAEAAGEPPASTADEEPAAPADAAVDDAGDERFDEELVVSEWPDPAEAGAVPGLDDDDDMPAGKDASAGGS
jgi:segregation and condensation protein B